MCMFVAFRIVVDCFNLIATCMIDRGIFLADSRQNTALAKLYLKYVFPKLRVLFPFY